jgi:hypothetical protein
VRSEVDEPRRKGEARTVDELAPGRKRRIDSAYQSEDVGVFERDVDARPLDLAVPSSVKVTVSKGGNRPVSDTLWPVGVKPAGGVSITEALNRFEKPWFATAIV